MNASSPIRQRLTAMQLLARFDKAKMGGMVDLRHCDLTGINMQQPAIKQGFMLVAQALEENREELGVFIDLSDSNISGIDLRFFDLSGVTMSRVNASHTIFVNAILSDTHLDSADLSFADFRQADLYHTKLYDAVLHMANFSGAKMSHTHGIGTPDTVVERLGVASTIRDAVLPAPLEPYRYFIQQANRAHRGDTAPVYANELIQDLQLMQGQDALGRITHEHLGGGEIFDEAWIERNSRLW